jgi:hypothetical protein
VPENPRIEELRRRVQKDPASIAFAQLAEEYRRAGRFDEAIDTCRTGLAHHPGYLSAHVTLGRALIETGDLRAAQAELSRVLSAAPENLAALRGVAEIHHRRGELPQALDHYRRALELAQHDPDLEHLVAQIANELQPVRTPPVVPDGLSFEEAVGDILAFSKPEPASGAEPTIDEPVVAATAPGPLPPTPPPPAPLQPTDQAGVWNDDGAVVLPEPRDEPLPEPLTPGEQLVAIGTSEPPPLSASPLPGSESRQVDALERWLDAVLETRQKK